MKETILMSREDLQEMMCGIVKNAVREVLDEFRQHRLRFPSHTCGRKLDDTIIRFELCPTAAETRGWTREDWMQLIHEFIQTLDRLEKDDDNEQWARRCALMASRLCKPAHRPKQKRGGYRR
jgi:hypothetical protein